jgi:hypothetical protein
LGLELFHPLLALPWIRFIDESHAAPRRAVRALLHYRTACAQPRLPGDPIELGANASAVGWLLIIFISLIPVLQINGNAII